ncbi:hypothetical protein BDY24DRAFT_396556 [Mrakia frigida]|uniref:uncharacterized protein n=1 Tax=Mrakia frigida TaxID=29902 RepID=UPI003FCBF185
MPIPRLPFDVLFEILSHVFQSYQLPSLPSSGSTPRKGSTSLLLVSKSFHELCLPLIYQSITIGRSSQDWQLFFAPRTGLLVGEQGEARRSWVRELRVHGRGVVAPVDFELTEKLLFEDEMGPFEISDFLVELCSEVSFPNLRNVGLVPEAAARARSWEREELVRLFRAYAEGEGLVWERDEDGDPCYCNDCIISHYRDIFTGIEARRASFILQLLLPSLPHLTSVSLSVSNCASPHNFEAYFLPIILHPSYNATLQFHYTFEADQEERRAVDRRHSIAAHVRGLHDVLPSDAEVQIVGFGRKTRKMIRNSIEGRSDGEDLANWEFVSSSTVEAFIQEC